MDNLLPHETQIDEGTDPASAKHTALFILLACSFSLLAQDQQPPFGGPNHDLQRKRAEWFYGQRAYPLGYIPAGARLEALKHLDRMLAAEALTSPMNRPSASIPASSTQWTLIGPQPTNNSLDPTIAGTPWSGRVTALAVDPRDANVVYLGAAEGGVWKTTNGGLTWTPLTDSQASLAIGSIALDPSNPNIVYVGTGEENFGSDNYYGAGILKSTDGGATWISIQTPFTGPFGPSSVSGGAYIGALAVHPANGQILLAAVERFNPLAAGIYRSSDAGLTWTRILVGAPGTAVLFDPKTPDVAYAAGFGAGIYKSTDAGITWAPVADTTHVLPTSNMGRIALAISSTSPITLYAGIEKASDGSLLGFFKTADGGVNWTQLGNTPDYCKPQCFFDHVIAVHPANSNVVFAGGSDFRVGRGLVRSLDGGLNWTSPSNDLSKGANDEVLHPDLHALAFSRDGSKLYAGNDGGVWSTTDAQVTCTTSGCSGASAFNWTNLNSTLAITQFYPGLSIHPTDSTISFGGTQDTATQKYSGNIAWDRVTCGDGAWTAIDTASPNTVYAACAGGARIRKSTSGGLPVASWKPVVSGILEDRLSFIPPLVIDPGNPQRLYFGTFRVYQTTDGAATWTPVSPSLTNIGAISTIAVAPSNSNVVYAGTNDAQVWVTLFATSGATATWRNVTVPPLPNRSITQIAVDPRNAATAYVTFSGFSGFTDTQGHVFKTNDGGSSWTDISGFLPNIPVNDIVVDPDVTNTLYVATDIGVFSTNNGGTTWSTLTSQLPRVAVLALRLHPPSRTLRAATHGRSAWDLLAPFPTPALLSISPSSAALGGAGFTLTVNGSNFVRGSTVQWNGSVRTTTFVSDRQLTASIPASDINAAGPAQVTVFTPAPGGGTSGSLAFSVSGQNPVPAMTSLSPASVTAAGAGFTLTVNGSNFNSRSVVQWKGSARTTTFASATQLTAVIPAMDIAAAGTAQVTVLNPTPGGGTSGSLTFTINNPAPALTSLSPSSAAAGSAGLTLTVSGTNFVSDTTVLWNGSPRTTTFVSAAQLTASLAAADLATGGTAQVTVSNPTPGGGTSGSLTFTINNPAPALTSLSPSSATAGSAGLTLTVSGSNFVSSSVVRWNGSNRSTTFVSSTQLRAAIPAADLATATTAQVAVLNPAPGGGTSSALVFTVTGPTISAGGIVNGASFGKQPPAAGSIGSLFGVNLATATQAAVTLPLPTTLGGVSVTLNGTPAPLFFVSPTQINFQFPWELAGTTQASVVVTVNGVASSAATITLGTSAPGLFSVNSSGSGQGAIQIANTAIFAAPAGSIPNAQTRPAQRGEFLTIYCTGLGEVNNRPGSGEAASADPLSPTTATPTVTIGGVPASVSFSGLSPGFVALYQVNVEIPQNAPPGDSIPVVLTIGGVSSNTVTIGIQ